MPPIANAQTIRVTVAEYSAATGAYFRKIAEVFEDQNPGDFVEIEVVPWDVLLQKLTTDISGNANPDISIIGTRWLIDFVSQDLVEPLDSYMEVDFKDRFFDVFLEPSIFDGETYGLPIAASARAMYYNKSLFEKAGVSKVPETWEELFDAAVKISGLGEGTYGFGLQGKEVETDAYFYYAFWAHGGQLIESDGTSGLDTEAGYTAAKIYQRLIQVGATQPGVTGYNRQDIQNLFKRGKLGMIFTAPFLMNQIKNEVPELEYGLAPIPSGPDGDKGTYGVTDSIVLFSNSEKKDVAWRFLDLVFTKENRYEFNKIEGFLPVSPAVAAEPRFSDNENLKEFTKLLPEAKFAPVIRGWEEIAAKTGNALQIIYLQKSDVREQLNKAATEINEILSK